MKIMIKKELYDEICEVFGIEKGIRTVVVPPANGRKGYQYQRNFPENKRENEFRGKSKKDSQADIVHRLKQLMDDVANNSPQSVKTEIREKKELCDCSDRKNIYYHNSRNPNAKNISRQDIIKRKIEYLDAEFLADKGFSVYLPEEKPTEISYDAIVNDVKFDFKNISGGLETIKKQYQSGLRQAPGIVIFFGSRKSTDYMRYRAIMNGATNTKREKSITIICFGDEDEIEFFDMRKIEKKGGTDRSLLQKSSGL